jgi:cob(I)alamin adenosyltransferase
VLPRIYTGTGDEGTTGLIGGERVPKDSPRIEACGSLDELNAMIGVVCSQALDESIEKILQRVQEDLFMLGAEIAAPKGSDPRGPAIEERIRSLENEIDALEDNLPPIKKFILPGGTVAAAELHLVRAVARRAERSCVSLSRLEGLNPQILRYLNRLSDLCFVLARTVNRQHMVTESHPTASRI